MSTKDSRVGMISLELGDVRQRRQTRVRHRDIADIGFDGAERIIGRLRGGRLRQRVEKRRLADIRQADDAAFEAHGSRRWIGEGRPSCAGSRQKARGARGTAIRGSDR